MKCPTTSGAYRCEREAGHVPPCETQAAEYKPAATVENVANLVAVVDILITRVLVLEAQVASLQMAMPRGIPT